MKEVFNQAEFEAAQREHGFLNAFSFDVLKCKYSNSLLVYPENLKFLELASRFNSHCPFHITSFYRSKKHPLTSASPNSKHARAIAFDAVPVSRMSLRDFATLLFGAVDSGKQAFPAIGLYSNHVHFDPILRNGAGIYWVGKATLESYNYEYFGDFWNMVNRYDVLKQSGGL